MTPEEKTELKTVLGHIEEYGAELLLIQERLQKRWDSMTGLQQEESPDLEQLILEIEDMRFRIDGGITDITGRLVLC